MSARLTAEEERVLNHLASAYNGFAALGGHCADDVEEFMKAIHQAQCLVALRVARRADPSVWRQPA